MIDWKKGINKDVLLGATLTALDSVDINLKWTLIDEVQSNGTWFKIQEYNLLNTKQFVVFEQRDGEWSHVAAKTNYQDALKYVQEGN